MSDHDAAMKSSLYQWIGATAVAAALACGGGTANAQTASAASQGNAFHAPPVFTSQNGALNIQINAKAKPIPGITFTSPTTGKKIHPTGFAYEICQANGTGCVWDYGGVRLALTQNDTLKAHFTNQLPKFDPNKLLHAVDEPNIFLNPTNLHTHGLLTPARAPTRANPTWGDNIFVQVFNPANGTPDPAFNPHNMGDVVVGSIDYSIPVREQHAVEPAVVPCACARDRARTGVAAASRLSSPSARSATTSPETRTLRRSRKPTSAT